MGKKTTVAVILVVLLAAFLVVRYEKNKVDYSTTTIKPELSPTPFSIVGGGAGVGTSRNRNQASSDLQITDASGTPLASINWGSVSLGVNVTNDFNLTNTGSSPIVIGAPTFSDLIVKNPAKNVLYGNYTQYFALGSNCTGIQLNHSDTVTAELSLIISPDINQNATKTQNYVAYFSFSISIWYSQG